MTDPSSSAVWYALRTTYGRERKAFEYITAQGATTFYPTTTCRKITHNGKPIRQEMSLLPNIFFLHATEDEAKSFVYDNEHLPYLRFYYDQHHDGTKEPLIIPDQQIENLRILCESRAVDTLLVPNGVDNFKEGQTVRIIGGSFKGITGIVARWHGQQRVGINLDGIGTVATAYVPSAFIERIA